MKKLALILISLCFIIISCRNRNENNETDKPIRYNGPTTINIAQQDIYKINASSEEALTYYSDNENIVTVDNDGNIKGKSIGEANITISNSDNEIKIRVIVTLFVEPTLDFGCNQDKILSLYNPEKLIYNTDSVIIYSNWYSAAVWSMSFFFENDEYYESDLYILNDLDMRVNEYLDKNYHYYEVITNDNGKEIYVYLNAADESDATVMVGKMYNANEEDDICLMYTKYPYDSRVRVRLRH